MKERFHVSQLSREIDNFYTADIFSENILKFHIDIVNKFNFVYDIWIRLSSRPICARTYPDN